jgi:alpha-ketoglutarate-dependent 2,4-dichlorophenoxyacetate dioxygenase
MRLDPTLRERLENSFAWHDYAHSRGKIAPDLASPEERAALPPQCWRMAWKNPANGRVALYLASHAYAIEGMEQAAAQKLLAELIEAATAPGLSYVHIWRNGDVVVGQPARLCIAVDPGPRTRRGLWCAQRFPRPRRTG